jgi:tetratricopeptide (TPR) repeat protein
VVLPLWYPTWYGLYGGPYYYGCPWWYYDYGTPYYGYGSTVTVYSAPRTYVEESVIASPPVAVPEVAAPAPDVLEVAPPAAAAPAEAAAAEAAPAEAPKPDAKLAEEYAAKARALFRQGAFRDALRQANHAAVESPEDPKVHELMSLALFALKDYRGAAIEAHAAVGLGRPGDWPTISRYYGNADTYTKQFRDLEKFVRENPKSAEGHFLLGYHDLLTGNKEAAKKHLAEAVKLTPQDELAAQMLKKL